MSRECETKDGAQFFVLGTVGFRNAGGVEQTIGGTKTRTLLAALLLAAGRRVPLGALVEQLWEHSPPCSAVKNIQLYAHRLRRLLDAAEPGGGSRMRWIADGYRLHTRPEEVDLYRAERAAAEAEAALRRDDLRGAAALLDAALAEWSEYPLGGVTDSAALAATAARLRERRIDLLEQRSLIDVRADHYAAAVNRLYPVCAYHPTRESLHTLLMTALGRSGRRSEAIGVFHQLRHHLGDSLGIDPDRRTVAAYQELLGTG